MSPTILIPCLQGRAALQAAKSLGRAGYPVIGAFVRSSGFRVGLHSPCVPELIECPDPLLSQRDFRQWLADYLAENPSTLVLPVHEAVVHAANQLRREGVPPERFVLANPQGLANSLSKFIATKSATMAGVTIPDTFFLRAPGKSEYAPLPADREFPCLLKWDNSEDESGAYHKGSNRKIADRAELDTVLAELSSFSCGVIVQTLVPGHGVGAFFLRHKGRIILRFAHRRLHEVPWPGGVSSYCESSCDAEVLDAGERLLEAIDYEGVAMVEFRVEEGRPPAFLEINGRLWGSLGLAIAAGADFPRAMVECHVHGKTGAKQPDNWLGFRWHDPDLQMDYLRSLWREPGPMPCSSTRWAGIWRVLCCFIDPRVKSDWWEWNRPLGSLKRYVRLWRREMAWLKAQGLQCFKSQETHPLVVSAVERTLAWSRNPGRPQSILFLCYGNILRSPYSEKRWNSWRKENPKLPPAYSVGFHDNACRETPARFKSAAGYRGVDLSAHRSRQVVAADVAEASVIFAMDLRNLGDMERKFPEAMGKTLLLGALGGGEDAEIPDPYGQPIGAGGTAYRRIDLCLVRMRNLMGSSE